MSEAFKTIKFSNNYTLYWNMHTIKASMFKIRCWYRVRRYFENNVHPKLPYRRGIRDSSVTPPSLSSWRLEAKRLPSTSLICRVEDCGHWLVHLILGSYHVMMECFYIHIYFLGSQKYILFGMKVRNERLYEICGLRYSGSYKLKP